MNIIFGTGFLVSASKYIIEVKFEFPSRLVSLVLLFDSLLDHLTGGLQL